MSFKVPESSTPTQVPPFPKLLPPPLDPLLVPDDQIRVQISGHSDLSVDQKITPLGEITMNLIGRIKVIGLSASKVEEDIRERLSKHLRDPKVIVEVSYVPRRIFIVGSVARPGRYDLLVSERLMLLEFISMAGGFTGRAYKEQVQIVRRIGSEHTIIQLSIIELERAIARGQGGLDPELWPGDMVIIPSVERSIHIMGAIGQSGSLELPGDAPLTLSKAVARMGGYTKFAATSRILVLRSLPTGETKKITVDLDAILDGQLSEDLELFPGDLVYIPERGLF